MCKENFLARRGKSLDTGSDWRGLLQMSNILSWASLYVLWCLCCCCCCCAMGLLMTTFVVVGLDIFVVCFCWFVGQLLFFGNFWVFGRWEKRGVVIWVDLDVVKFALSFSRWLCSLSSLQVYNCCCCVETKCVLFGSVTDCVVSGVGWAVLQQRKSVCLLWRVGCVKKDRSD